MEKLRQVGEYVFAIAVLVLIWQLYIVLFNVPAYMFPTPKNVGTSLIDLVVSQNALFHFSVTLSEVLIGFVLGTLLGLIMGYLITKVRILEEALMPYILMAQTAPKIALAPLLVIWFGLGLLSKVVLIISMVFFPVMLGMIFGMRSISYNLKCLMQITGLNHWQKIFQVELPHSLPFIFSGLKIGIVQAVIAAIVSEWIAGDSGLGFMLVFNSTTYNSAGLFATIIYTIILGILYYQLIQFLENKLLFWHESKQ